MDENKKTFKLSDDELDNVTGGTEVPTEPCPYGRTKCDPFWCRKCGYATDLETGVATSCTLGYPNATSGVIPI